MQCHAASGACYRMDLPQIGSQHSGCLTTSDRSQKLLEDVVEILQNLDKLRGLETSIAQSEETAKLENLHKELKDLELSTNNETPLQVSRRLLGLVSALWGLA